MTSTQKALYIPEKFGAFVIRETEVYTPGPGEVLVKIQATALNPIDWAVQKMGVIVEKYPAILGYDIAGDVVQVGDGVTEFKEGDRVLTQGAFQNKMNAFQQYALAYASSLAKIPETISYDEASTLPVALATAYVGLYNKAPYGLGFTPPTSAATQGIYSGVPIIIVGGTTSVGQHVIQLAKLSGFSPIIATASLHQTDYLKDLGATHVFDRNLTAAELQPAIAKITNGVPVKTVYASISSPAVKQLGLELLAPGGQLLMFPPESPVEGDKSIRIGNGTIRLPGNIALLEPFFHDVLAGFLEQGLTKFNEIEVIPGGLAGIVEGLARLESGKVSKLKLVVHPQETP